MTRPSTIARSWLYGTAGVALLVAAWSAAVRLGGAHLLPGPARALAGIVDLARRGVLVSNVVASLFRVTWGYLLAVAVGLPLGLLLGVSRRARLALGPLVQVLRPISPLAWTPLAILWCGLGDPASVFIIFVAAALPLAVAAMNAAAGVPEVYLRAGRNFGLSRRALVLRVVVPAAAPELVVGLRVALGAAWLEVVAAEMLAVGSGLGFVIVDARNAGDRWDLVFAGMLLVGALGLLLDAGIRRLPWGRRR